MGKNLKTRVEDYDFVKGGKLKSDAYTLETSKMSERDLKDLLNYIDSEYKFSTTIWLPAYIEEGLNEDARKTDPSLKEHIGKTVSDILEDEDGENSYIKVKFTDKTQLSITAYPMGGRGVGLVAEGSLNEGAKILTKDLSREGEEFVAWIEKTMKTGTIKTISLEKNTAEVTFNENTDLTDDLFNMVREWPNAPAYMDLYVDVMSVNRGRLVMMVYGKRGMSFTA
jgi:hypothetical protein